MPFPSGFPGTPVDRSFPCLCHNLLDFPEEWHATFKEQSDFLGNGPWRASLTPKVSLSFLPSPKNINNFAVKHAFTTRFDGFWTFGVLYIWQIHAISPFPLLVQGSRPQRTHQLWCNALQGMPHGHTCQGPGALGKLLDAGEILRWRRGSVEENCTGRSLAAPVVKWKDR